MTKRRRWKAGCGVLAAVVVVSSGFVGWSVVGRGTRSPVGVEARAVSQGLEIAYHRHGDGEPVVLLASLARSVSDLNELAEALAAAGYETIAVESRGVGGSGGGGPRRDDTLHDLAADVAAVLDETGHDRVHVVGHAFGNRVARTFAANHPDRAHTVALIAAGGKVRVTPETRRALTLSAMSFLPDVVREDDLRDAFFAEESAIPEHWDDGWWFWAGLAQAEAAMRTQPADYWAAGTVPILVVQAEDDTVAPPETSGLALAEEFPDRVTFVAVSDAGHALLPEQPAAIERAVVDFLRAHPIPQP